MKKFAKTLSSAELLRSGRALQLDPKYPRGKSEERNERNKRFGYGGTFPLHRQTACNIPSETLPKPTYNSSCLHRGCNLVGILSISADPGRGGPFGYTPMASERPQTAPWIRGAVKLSSSLAFDHAAQRRKGPETVSLVGQNKTAVVVSSTLGMGAAVARLLAKIGCHHINIFGYNMTRGADMFKQLKKLAPTGSEIQVMCQSGIPSVIPTTRSMLSNSNGKVIEKNKHETTTAMSEYGCKFEAGVMHWDIPGDYEVEWDIPRLMGHPREGFDATGISKVRKPVERDVPCKKRFFWEVPGRLSGVLGHPKEYVVRVGCPSMEWDVPGLEWDVPASIKS
ncbi:hypothetical protein B0H11DRAFT_1931547 [Mycena galericulata]|nr:hypothetical protein B0H11DRAFT_1931547 [Mycena galericulata]